MTDPEIDRWLAELKNLNTPNAPATIVTQIKRRADALRQPLDSLIDITDVRARCLVLLKIMLQAYQENRVQLAPTNFRTFCAPFRVQVSRLQPILGGEAEFTAFITEVEACAGRAFPL